MAEVVERVSLSERVRTLRDWFPVPRQGGDVDLTRWVVLEGNRIAVTISLMTFVFVAIMVFGTVNTFEMQRLLTETPAVETILNTLLRGIILLVSIVVSINSIVLSHDITSLKSQEDRISGVIEFRRQLDRLTGSGEQPTNPASFLDGVSASLLERAHGLEDATANVDEALARDVRALVQSIEQRVADLEAQKDHLGGADFGMLWLSLEYDYAPSLERTRVVLDRARDAGATDLQERSADLIETYEVFVTGKEYFKTVYYEKDVSQLSRTLLVVSLPAILVNATSILAINAELLPEIGLFGLPPLLTFFAATFTISLTPFLVLTAYMLRLATVARRTAALGPFSISD